MAQFDIPEAFEIPYFDHGKNISKTIKNSSSRRKMNPMLFVFRKIRNIILYQLSFFCPLNSWRVKMHKWRGVHVGNNVYIGQQCSIDNAYPEYVFLEDDISLAGEVTIVVRKGAWVSVKSTLLGGADIGEYAIVSAGSVVSNKVPAYTMVVGNPAKKIYNFEHILNKK